MFLCRLTRCKQILKAFLDWLFCYYCLPTKLREGNVFSRVCPSVILSNKGSHVTITRDALDLTVQGQSHPPFGHRTSLCRDAPQTWDLTVQVPFSNDIWWPRLETCSNLTTWWPTPRLPHQPCWYLVTIELSTVRASASRWYASYWNALFCTVIEPLFATH